MENIEKLLGTLQEQSFIFNYGDREARIDLDILLSDYDDGTLFIDYISDFYYVQSVYQKLKNSEDADPVEKFQDFSENSASYYKLLSLIKFFYSELKICLYEIKDDAKFRRRMHIGTYREYFDESYSYIMLDLDESFIYIKSILDERNKILAYFIKHYDKEFPTFKKLIFLAIILELLITDEEVIDIHFAHIEGLFESFSKKISHLTRLFQSLLSSHLSSDKLCLVSTATNDWFGEMIFDKNFSTELNKLKGKKRKKLNCYAIAYGDNFDYYAINNLDGEDRQELHDLFTRLLKDIPVAQLTNDVRYFLPNEIDYITYEEFQSLPDKPNGEFNRMFTCCERKLFAKLRKEESKINKMNILVTQAPCVYCSRELNYIKKKGSMTIDINYPELDRINTHDCLAQKIFDSSSNLVSTSIRILIWIKQKFKFNLRNLR